MPYNSITFEIDDGVGLIRLNRPNEGNALIPEMARELLMPLPAVMKMLKSARWC